MHRLRGVRLAEALSVPSPGSRTGGVSSSEGPAHLVRRFAGSVWPGGPGPAGDAWARQWLSPAETELWSRMSGPDRRHALAVCRAVAAQMGNADGAGVPRRVLAAALLHDAGKTEAGLGTLGRVAATVAQRVAGRERVASWSGSRHGLAGRIGRYADYGRLGAATLEAAGSDPLVRAWSVEHHLEPRRWTVDPDIGRILKAADDGKAPGAATRV